jgi:transcriptional regulator of heat shock response
VPSEKGFRYYVIALPESMGGGQAAERRIARVLDSSDTPEELMSRTSFLLSEISKTSASLSLLPLQPRS